MYEAIHSSTPDPPGRETQGKPDGAGAALTRGQQSWPKNEASFLKATTSRKIWSKSDSSCPTK